MADRKLTGKVIDRKGNPVPEAEVWLSRHGGATETQTTGAAGEFSIDLSKGDGWSEGAATLGVRPKDSPLVEKKQVQIPAEGSPEHQPVMVHARGEIGAFPGWLFLVVATVWLIVVAGYYLDLHGVTVAKLRNREPIAALGKLSEPLADMLDAAEQQVAAARQALAAADAAESQEASGQPAEEPPAEEPPAEEPPADEPPADEPPVDEPPPETEGEEVAASRQQRALQEAMVGDSLKIAEEIFAQLKTSRVGLFEDDKVAALDGLFAQAETALNAGAIDALDATLERLLDQVEEPVFLWEDSPARLLEVMFWALAATLLRLIFNAGYYLYKSSFLKTAIPHHLAFLVIIPIVAVIISFVLTLVQIELQLGDNALTLDLSNVLISILVAALIGLSPWESWGFLHQLADRLFTALAGLFKVGDQGATDG